jgi:hypothetical protein
MMKGSLLQKSGKEPALEDEDEDPGQEMTKWVINHGKVPKVNSLDKNCQQDPHNL